MTLESSTGILEGYVFAGWDQGSIQLTNSRQGKHTY